MNGLNAEYALSLIAEAAAHGVTILFSNRDIGVTTHRCGWEPPPPEMLAELDAHANEIWAILYSYRQAAAS